MNIYKDNTSE